jgi:hypothetical protein
MFKTLEPLKWGHQTAQCHNLELPHAAGIPLTRFYNLEHEYRQISARISKTSNFSERTALQQHRKQIVDEARGIIN